MNTQVDKLVMLLSSDWFFDYWELIGLEAEVVKKRALQHCCREIVHKILIGIPPGEKPVYFNTDFTEQRIKDTHGRFFNSVEEVGLGINFAAAARELLDGPSTNERNKIFVLASAMTQLIRAADRGSSLHLSFQIAEKARRAWREVQPPAVDLRQSNLRSESEWDRFIRNLTSDPDLAGFLSDYAEMDLIKPATFVRFWNLVMRSLTQLEKELLRGWFVAAATAMTISSLSSPDLERLLESVPPIDKALFLLNVLVPKVKEVAEGGFELPTWMK